MSSNRLTLKSAPQFLSSVALSPEPHAPGPTIFFCPLPQKPDIFAAPEMTNSQVLVYLDPSCHEIRSTTATSQIQNQKQRQPILIARTSYNSGLGFCKPVSDCLCNSFVISMDWR